MKITLWLIAALLWQSALFAQNARASQKKSAAPKAEKITINRYLTITTCEPGQKCVDYSPQAYFSPVTHFDMTATNRRNPKSTEAWDRQELLLHEVPIKSEIHFMKNAKLKKNAYSLTLHLKVGSHRQLRQQTKSFKFTQPSDILKKTIDSGAFPFKRGTMRVKLSIEPNKMK